MLSAFFWDGKIRGAAVGIKVELLYSKRASESKKSREQH